MFKGENMENLAIITLITACVTIYYKVIKSIADSIIYFFPFKSDYYRLKDDLTEEKEKDLKAFTFSIIIIFFASVVPYLWYKEKETFDVNRFLITLVALIFLSMCYVFIVLYHKGKKIMSIEIRSIHSYRRSDKKKIKLLFKRKTFYLHSKIDKDTYLFKDSTYGNYNKLTTLSKKDMLNAFSGYVEVKPTLPKTKISLLGILIAIFFAFIWRFVFVGGYQYFTTGNYNVINYFFDIIGTSIFLFISWGIYLAIKKRN